MSIDEELKKQLWFPSRKQRHLLTGRDHSLIFLRDYGIKNNLRRGETVHYVLYDQLLHNQNPCHIFEENKPGWSAPITAPHTLFGAMLNLPRPFLPSEPSDQITVCDPFVGSGTTACEAAKLPNVKFEGSDISHLTPYLVRDNLHFFSLKLEGLKHWENQILEMENLSIKLESSGGEGFILNGASQDHHWVASYVRKRDLDHITIDEEELAKTLEPLKEVDRLIHYMALRFVLRNEGALLRGADLSDNRARDIQELLDQIKGLISLRACKTTKGNGYLQKIPWTISPAVVVDPKAFAKFKCKLSRLSATDQSWAARENSYDVIVTDPPYGYNTQENLGELAMLYKEMIPIMINCLRPDGHLVMCLPERSYTGRKTYSFTHKKIVVREVLMAAKEKGFEVLTGAVPTPGALYRPPYYWRSEKALSRSIVYFRLRKRSSETEADKKKPRLRGKKKR